MNLWGVIFMALSWGLIIFLTVYSFSRIFSEKPGDQNGGQ